MLSNTTCNLTDLNRRPYLHTMENMLFIDGMQYICKNPRKLSRFGNWFGQRKYEGMGVLKVQAITWGGPNI